MSVQPMPCVMPVSGYGFGEAMELGCRPGVRHGRACWSPAAGQAACTYCCKCCAVVMYPYH